MIYGIEERKGFIAITGEIGVGKTTILRSYLESADPEKLKVVYIFNAMLSFESLLKQIFNELGLVPAESAGVPELVNRLHRFLIEEYKNERNVVLIIDEVQNMPIETLENLRMLSNLETSKDKLVQIVMVGQPEFDRKLELEELRQLKQRVAIRCRIKPLTREESLAYIQ
ncbi:MAG: AAA family ATPase, partial [Syntrophobacteraceae bacterium]